MQFGRTWTFSWQRFVVTHPRLHEVENHIDETTSGKSPSGSRVGVVYKGGGRSCRCATLGSQFHEGVGQELDGTTSHQTTTKNKLRLNSGRWGREAVAASVDACCSVRTPMIFFRSELKYVHAVSRMEVCPQSIVCVSCHDNPCEANKMVTSITLVHRQSDSIWHEVCARLEWSIVHSRDFLSLQMIVGSFVLACWRRFVQDNMSPNKKTMYEMVAVHALARSKELVGFSRDTGVVWHCFDVPLPHMLF